MLGVLTFLALFGGLFAYPTINNERIVNGTNAKLGEIPYIVSLRGTWNSHTCGGSILDETHVLTAAHCVWGSLPYEVSIQYGVLEISSDDHQSILAEEVDWHEQYDPWLSYANDVAVIKLKSPIPFSDTVQPIVLPEQDEDPPADTWGVLAGWGLPKSGGHVMKDLQRVDILVYSDEECRKAHHSTVSSLYHVCAGVKEGGKGQCNGDSGGPLYAGGKQIGTVSWSVKPCAVKGYPGVFARVSRYVNWIKKKMAL